MSQCPTVPATPATVIASQPSWVMTATPYMSQAASTVMQSQELPLSQLSPRALKRRLDLESNDEQSQRSSAPPPWSSYEVIKELIDHLYTLRSGDHSLLEYAVGVMESHDLKDGQWWPDWHCHVIVWAKDLVHSKALDLWKFKGVHPHEHLLALRTDKGTFPPLSALQYFKKEAIAWEAWYGNLTEEFLRGQSPIEIKAKQGVSQST
ncbi:unnamed protein product [Rhizoctonia solani]|uniref:Uncharacterized protein n=1 Tax=Rhizoctonia solani TaxID=456999 RepID=A0A8H2ZZE0_9AGAM|nr:unnamed protein product [Rhizoctonia solani]